MPLMAAARGLRPLGWLVAVMLAAGVAFVVLRVVTPDDGTQVPPRTWAWTGDGVLVEAAPGGTLRDGDLVAAIDGVALGDAGGGWRAPAQRSGDSLVYQVVRGGRDLEVPVTLGRARVVDRLLGGVGHDPVRGRALRRGGVPVRAAAGAGHRRAAGARERAAEQRSDARDRRVRPARPRRSGPVAVCPQHPGRLRHGLGRAGGVRGVVPAPVVAAGAAPLAAGGGLRHPGAAGDRPGAGGAGRCGPDPMGRPRHRRRDARLHGGAGGEHRGGDGPLPDRHRPGQPPAAQVAGRRRVRLGHPGADGVVPAGGGVRREPAPRPPGWASPGCRCWPA